VGLEPIDLQLLVVVVVAYFGFTFPDRVSSSGWVQGGKEGVGFWWGRAGGEWLVNVT